MIRGPVLPQSRDRLWAIVARRLEVIESGLALVLEGLDCSEGQHGAVDGLARDGAGAPVLVVLALDGDALLLPRVLGAVAFLERIGGALASAVPEGNFAVGAEPRLLVIGTDASANCLADLARLQVAQVELCLLEPFRLAGGERFAVRRLGAAALPPAGGAQASAFGTFPLDAAQEASWQSVVKLCERLDPAVRIDGHRFRRRISYCGRALGQVTLRDGVLRAAAGAFEGMLATKADVRAFGDHLVRRYAECAGFGAAPAGACARDDGGFTTTRRDSLRSAIAPALSAEEYAALSEATAPPPMRESTG